MFFGLLKLRVARRLEAHVMNVAKRFIFKALLFIEEGCALLDRLTYVRLSVAS